MSNDVRIDPSNEVCLGYDQVYDGSNWSYSYAAITLAGDFSGSDTVAVLYLYSSAADWLGKAVLLRDAGYTGTIPSSRFSLGNFVDSHLPITSYVINSEGKLVNK
jgi:hypothetical protein